MTRRGLLSVFAVLAALAAAAALRAAGGPGEGEVAGGGASAGAEPQGEPATLPAEGAKESGHLAGRRVDPVPVGGAAEGPTRAPSLAAAVRTDLAGCATFAARVYVDDAASSHPLRGASVRILRRAKPTGSGSSGDQVLVEAATDEAGRVLLRGLPREEGCTLVVTVAGHEEDRRDLEPPEAGEVRPVWVTLVPFAWVSGRVVDAGGEPLSRVQVKCLRFEGRSERRTDDRGRFGPVEVRVADPKGLDAEMEVDVLRAHGSATVHVAPGETRGDLEIRLEPWPEPPRFARGRVLLPDGHAAAGAWVRVDGPYWAPGDDDAPLEGSARADPAGRFRLALPPGVEGRPKGTPERWTLVGSLPGFAPAYQRVGGEGPEGPVRLTLGAARRLEGRVVFEDGTATSHASVVALPLPEGEGVATAGSSGPGPAPPDGGPPQGRALASTTTDAEGRYVLEDLPLGTVVVTATVGYGRCGHVMRSRAWAPERPGGGLLELRLPSLAGRAPPEDVPPLLEPEEAPAVGERDAPAPRDVGITLVRPSGELAADEDHECQVGIVAAPGIRGWAGYARHGRIECALVPGTYRLRGRGSTIASFDVPFTVPSGAGPVEVRVEVEDGATVGGPVVGAVGLVAADVEVRVVSLAEKEETRWSGVEAGDRVVVRHLAPGRHGVEAHVLGRPDLVLSSPTEIEVGRVPLEVLWRLEPGTRVPVRLEVFDRIERDGNGEEKTVEPDAALDVLDAAGTVRAHRDASAGPWECARATQGGMSVATTSAWLAPGRYRFRAVVAGAVAAETVADVALEGEPLPVVVVVRP